MSERVREEQDDSSYHSGRTGDNGVGPEVLLGSSPSKLTRKKSDLYNTGA